ncbi:hypothetical protein [Rossellomorea aquimaris]|uniref:hypothetical protein n=1 Tax=Rossellomorea aquimaris TaxID=189382 RepID=UPI001CFD16C2|nr:hypothetical protein [Rossellomorea aquimaris]
MKKIFMILLAITLFYGYTSPSFAEAKKKSNETVETVSYPVKSMETGEVVGEETHEITTTIINSKNGKTIVMNDKITNKNFKTNQDEVTNQKNTLVYDKKNNLVSINGENVDSTELEKELGFDKIELGKNDLNKLKPLAEKYNSGETDYEEYLNQVKELDLDIVKNNEVYQERLLKSEKAKENNQFQIAASGGLSWITYYYTSSRGGYNLKAGKMTGSSLNYLMLDSSAVQSGSMRYKHNYLQGSQGGLVASFMQRADSISGARSELITEAAALTAALGVAVLTLATVIGAIGAAGSAGLIAARMYNVSSGAHTNIKRCYELIGTINSQ